MTDLAPESTPTEANGNARPYSVSELAFALKRTLEDAYGFVRLRGELSKVTHHSNGHVYLTIKDERAAIDGVVWKGSVRNLSIRPEQGLEVVITGKITTYPAGSRYQIVIETMEAAGVGALLAQLERLKARLQAEGLFDPARKKPLPAMPAVVGVITSPTGAVIRDILHRIRDRWPCRVIVWPVVVQGEAASGQVRAAIDGFNAMTPDGPVPRPDILIVARGGGSVEDLWAFNDEALARTVFASAIPLISAVGHETDTTLIDFVSDRRAPTPTAAAEIATPVLAELRGLTLDLASRLHRVGGRLVDDRRGRIDTLGRSLARVPDLLELAKQRFNLAESRLGASLQRNFAAHRTELLRTGARLSLGLLQRPQAMHTERLGGVSSRLAPAVGRTVTQAIERFDVTNRRLTAGLQANFAVHRNEFNRAAAGLNPRLLQRPQALQNERLASLATRLHPGVERGLDRAGERLLSLGKLYASVDPSAPLKRGFARVHRADGSLVREGLSLQAGEGVRLFFADTTREAVIDGTPADPASLSPPPKAASPRPSRPKPVAPDQGDLF